MKDLVLKECDDVDCCKKLLEERLPEILENPIIKEFLDVKENEIVFRKAMESCNEQNLMDLNKRFKEFYRSNRISRYTTGLIKRYSIDYDKRVKLRNNRYQLIIDKPINDGRDGANLTMGNILTDSNKTPYEILEEKERMKNKNFIAENQLLQKSVGELDPKQIEILHLKYVEGYNNKEIGEMFGQTEQNISYWHKKTLKQLKKSMELGE